MRKAVVVLHSVTGNCFCLGKCVYETLVRMLGVDAVRILRVEDKTLEETAPRWEHGREYLEELLSIPIATCSDVIESDIVVMGSPTYFGNVSAQMKQFMDLFVKVFEASSTLIGKSFISFTTAGSAVGGGEKCLDALNTFAQHLGMRIVSVPFTTPDGQQTYMPAYGFLHVCGDKGTIRPTGEEKIIIGKALEKMLQ